MATTNAVVPVSLAEGVTFNVSRNSNADKLPQYEEVASLLKNIKQVCLFCLLKARNELVWFD